MLFRLDIFGPFKENRHRTRKTFAKLIAVRNHKLCRRVVLHHIEHVRGKFAGLREVATLKKLDGIVLGKRDFARSPQTRPRIVHLATALVAMNLSSCGVKLDIGAAAALTSYSVDFQ